MAISNTYQFGNTQIDDLIREAYERIGIIGNEVTPLQLESAIMSANLELTQWMGKLPLSWTRKRLMMQVYIGQPAYNLPKGVVRVVDVIASQPLRMNQGGNALSSSGNAANVFNPQNNAGCLQAAPDGWIAYNYGTQNQQAIQYFGIQTFDDQNSYTLDIQYSFDGTNFLTALTTPLTTYYIGKTTWYVVEAPQNAVAWRIKETGGSTLRIAQLYFSLPSTIGQGDRYLTSYSYTEWMQIAAKLTQSFAAGYFFNAQTQPYLMLWPVVGPQSIANLYTSLVYTAYMYMADVSYLFQNFDMPQRFYEVLVCGLSKRLASKFAPDKVPMWNQEYQVSFAEAAAQDAEVVPLRIQPDFSNYSR